MSTRVLAVNFAGQDEISFEVQSGFDALKKVLTQTAEPATNDVVARATSIVISFLTLACASAGCAASNRCEGSLEVLTQRLLDGVATGDKALWDQHLDDETVYVSEAGDVLRKNQLLDELQPLPPGLVGSIRVTKFDTRVHGDFVVATHDDQESLDYFGQKLSSRFLTTNVWKCAGDTWRIVATQVYAVLVDPPKVTLAPEELDEYVGVYELTPELVYEISRDGDKLVGVRTGRKPAVLEAELRDVFFIAGQPRVRKIFLRDAKKTITGFADRREGHDIMWRRR